MWKVVAQEVLVARYRGQRVFRGRAQCLEDEVELVLHGRARKQWPPTSHLVEDAPDPPERIICKWILNNTSWSIQGCTVTGFRHRPVGQVRQQSEPVWQCSTGPIISGRSEDFLFSLIFDFFYFCHHCACMWIRTNKKQRTLQWNQEQNNFIFWILQVIVRFSMQASQTDQTVAVYARATKFCCFYCCRRCQIWAWGKSWVSW